MSNKLKANPELIARIFGTTVPSEVLEPHVTKIMGILFHDYAKNECTDVGFKVILGQARALGMLISECRATHCNLAFTNEVQSMLWQMERDPEFKKKMDKHFIKVYKKSMGLKD